MEAGTFTGSGFGMNTIKNMEWVFAGNEDFIDVIKGDAADNYFSGARGDDRMNGGGGDDRLFGGEGGDLLVGGDGDDRLEGDRDDTAGSSFSHGKDFLKGGDGNDTLLGGGNRDKLFGQAGADLLNGGDGDDILLGGSGKDTFQFSLGTDRVRDFEREVDKIDVSGGDSTASFHNLDEMSIREVQGAVMITAGASVLIIENITFTELRPADFIFT